VLEPAPRGLDRITCSTLFRLDDKARKLADLGQSRLLDFLGLMTNHDEYRPWIKRLRGSHDVCNQRRAAQFVQHFRALRFHSRSEARGHDENVE
jgi:hypothetical protein